MQSVEMQTKLSAILCTLLDHPEQKDQILKDFEAEFMRSFPDVTYKIIVAGILNELVKTYADFCLKQYQHPSEVSMGVTKEQIALNHFEAMSEALSAVCQNFEV